ncbi:MAG: hypothetical protein LBR69_02515 [Endomicrobium sp.]|jgi:antitoxin component YwqK of YwqJK toxin-antitoxin module|nr:hypothetical protein [Endomicrobium sp.]
MMKKALILLVIASFFPANLFGVVYKKKESSGKDSFFVYTDKTGAEISREKILPDGGTRFVSGIIISGEVQELGENGKPVYQWNYRNSKPEGPAYKFYPGGEKLYELNYKAGVLSGDARKFYEDGSIAEEAVYVKGEVEGTATVYMKNGNFYKYVYKDNMLNGLTHLYDKNGRLIESSSYKDGVLEGTSRKYYLSGAVKSEMEYSHGKLDGYVRNYDEKGQEVNVLLYRNGKEIGSNQETSSKNTPAKADADNTVIWRGPAQMHLTDSNRALNELRFFAKNKYLNGEYKVKYKNGRTHFEGKFKNNKPDGVFKTYSRDGVLIARDIYSNGRLNGTSVMYYATGEKFAEFKYSNGKLHGELDVYKKGDDKTPVIEAKYRNGLMYGSLEVFYESGQLCFEAYFADGVPVGQLRYYFPKDKRLKYLIEFKNGKVYKTVQYSYEGFVEFEDLYEEQPVKAS